MWRNYRLVLLTCERCPMSVCAGGNGSRRTLLCSTGFRRALRPRHNNQSKRPCSTGSYRPCLTWSQAGTNGLRCSGRPGRSEAAPGPGHGVRQYRDRSAAVRVCMASSMPRPGPGDRGVPTEARARDTEYSGGGTGRCDNQHALYDHLTVTGRHPRTDTSARLC